MRKVHRSLLVSSVALLALLIGNLYAQPTRWNVLFFISDEHSPHFMSIDSQSPQNVFTPNLDRTGK